MPEHLAAAQPPSVDDTSSNRDERRLPDRLAYSPAEFAEAVGICEAHVHNLIRRGELRSLKLGRRRLILATEIERLAAEQDAASAGDPA